jgi:hypothetical protein
MAAETLEERVSELERKMARLLAERQGEQNMLPWWKKIVGKYKDDPEFEEAMRLGREYRESLRPKEHEETV